MIRVQPAPEPPHFDSTVRQPGLSAIAELVGEPSAPRRGRKRAVVAPTREQIPPSAFPPLWREAIPDMLTGYGHTCAYACIYIERVTGSATVDHMFPKSRHWDQVYEWSNYRLACSRMNSRKGESEHVIDPFLVEPGWFELDLTSFDLEPGAGVSAEVAERIWRTIKLLGLNDRDCRLMRSTPAEAFWEEQISFSYLAKRAPFVAYELQRQNRLTR